MNYYSNKQVNTILDKTREKGADIFELPGCLLDNYLILPTDKTKGFFIKEVYLNEWSSGYAIRAFNKISKRVEKILKLLDENNVDKALELFFK